MATNKHKSKCLSLNRTAAYYDHKSITDNEGYGSNRIHVGRDQEKLKTKSV